MPVVAFGSNYMLSQETANHGGFLSLHTAYSATGTNEVVGSPYTRQTTSWGAASGGVISLTNTPTFSVPAANTVPYIGLWDANPGGNFQGMFPNSVGQNAFAFAVPAGTASTFLAPGSAYAVNQSVVVFPSPGSVLPTPFTAGTIYYINGPSSDSFQLSATSGGGIITVTGDGSGIVQYIAPEAYISSGTFTVATGSLTII